MAEDVKNFGPTEKDLIRGFKYIVLRDGYLGGRPALLGKRVPVTQILQLLSDGANTDDLRDSLNITEEEIREVLRYAAEMTAAPKNVVNR